MSVLLISGRFYRKRTKNSKIWVISKVHAAAKGSFSATWLRRRNQTVSSSPRRSTVHSMAKCCALFSFAILSFRGLVYWINEDPISVYKDPFMLKR